ncbi:MAG: DUF4965 domain-containing protein [Bacteroidales bacterium]|nr:DUF4965 domain-containing protein [Bacteroidales bacterium]
MKRILTLALAATLALSAFAAPQKNSLRAPAYPLVTIDPNTSAWSMSDNLYDEPVKHWTGKDFPLIGAIKVDNTVYRFMGAEAPEFKVVIPTSIEADWSGKYTFEEPAADWMNPGFDDAAWAEAPAAWGHLEAEAKTPWKTPYIWVRRTIELKESLAGKPIYLDFSNDDDAVFYIDGKEVYSTGNRCNKNRTEPVPAEIVAGLGKGKHVLAAKCWNRVGNALLDFGLKVQVKTNSPLTKSAVQKSADVQAMRTHYEFECGPVNLKVSFTAPMFMDDLDLMSRPVNYLSYDIATRDGKAHKVSLYFEASPRWALDLPTQPSVSEIYEKDGLIFTKAGSVSQGILRKKGDDRRIDWGYFYMVAENDGMTVASLGNSSDLRAAFPKGKFKKTVTSAKDAEGQMAFIRNIGKVSATSGKIMLGYDDIYSIQYFKDNLRPWWNRRGDQTIEGQFAKALAEYNSLIPKCDAFDEKLMADAEKAGGRKYAEICALVYRQAIAAHKLVEAPNGDVLWLSKENNSNGSIGTVDVTYPSAPLFLLYNPVLAEGLMNHIYYYSESGIWSKPFPAHDVGTYPIANGQTYGGDMPVEEAGNMLSLTAAVCDVKGNADYARKHWDVLTTWTEYLVQFGLDPENQLCTDDFAGHFAHNANLSVKAILGIASYARMAEMLGDKAAADKYFAISRDLAGEWQKMAFDGDHYRLTFDKPGTWSQKYNLVWDKLLKLNVFDPQIAKTEIAYYLTRQNVYGLPLDSRKEYTKTDWIVWTATLADSAADFEAFIAPVHKFYNETEDRVPASDWTWTDSKHHRGFKARSVVGGFFIKMLDK